LPTELIYGLSKPVFIILNESKSCQTSPLEFESSHIHIQVEKEGEDGWRLVEAVGTSGGDRGGSLLTGGVQGVEEGVSWWGGYHLAEWLVLLVRERTDGGVV
jgi:hypothetical protein